jgi:hypothetical protein
MARFAPVCNLAIYQGLRKNRMLGDYHLLLAHDVLDKKDGYKEVFAEEGYSYSPMRVVIMDNSVIELGNHVNLDTVLPAVQATNANVVVLPDVLEDWQATVDAFHRYYVEWSTICHKELKHDYSFMVVPQGKTIEEFTRCAEHLAHHTDDIGWWGIPRNLVKLHGSREKAIKVCHLLNPHRKIHMLGFSDNNIDDLLCAQLPIVSGIDSAVPVRASWFNLPWTLTLEYPPRGNWFEVAEYSEMVLQDINRARVLFNGGRP